MRRRETKGNLAAAVLALLALLVGIGCGSGGGSGFTTPPVTTTIDTTGGSVTTGNATLAVPAGAVSGPTLISVQPASSYLADTRIVKSTVYSFDANGVTFVQPVTIRIQYSTANMPTGAVESSLALFKLVSNSWTQVSSSSLDTTNKVVTGTDTTLGIYAVLATTINSTGGGTTSAVSVLFTSDRAAAYVTPNLYTVNGDGTGLKPLTNLLQGESVSSGFFKPDGTLIVFTKQTSGGSDLDIMNSDGTALTTLIGGDTRPDGTRAHYHDAEFSADGTKIVYASDRTGADELYIMNSDGTNVKELTQNSTVGDQMGPVSFTRTGQISVTFLLNGTTTYYLINADGTGLTQVNGGALTLLPWWNYSPAGTSIVYTKAVNGVYDIYVAKPDGSSATKLTTLSATAIRKTRYSHDGSKILFDAALSGGNPDVYAINPDGTGLLNLTNNAASDRFMDAH